MALWTKVIAETFQLGGRLVFLQDHAPANFAEWLAPVRHLTTGASVIYSSKDLELAHFRTNCDDLVILFPQQISLLKSLDALMAGQRAVIATTPELSSADVRVDYTFAGLSLKEWNAGIPDFEKSVGSLTIVRDEDLKRCLFLDRDDVIVPNVPYNKDASKVELMPGIVELINSAHAQGYWVACVTNQSGLGRGWVQWSEYKEVHQQMLSLLAKNGCWLDECVWASYIDEAPTALGNLHAGMRKPRVGMFQQVQRKLHVAMAESVMIGDSATDLIAAFSAGVGRLYLLKSEKFEKELKTLKTFKDENPSFDFSELPELNASIL